jgi:ferredoxin--NADP+ reductase
MPNAQGPEQRDDGPELADVVINLARPREPVTARVVASRPVTNGRSNAFVRHFAIDLGGTALAGTFRPGQAFGILPPGVDERGRPHSVRLYSTSSPSWGEDGEGRVVATAVKRVIDERKPQREGDDPEDHSLFLGVCSNYMCDLRVGDEVQVTGPAGKRFVLPQRPGEHHYLFVATGTGIAPFRGMILELLEHPRGPVGTTVHLVMGAPYSTDLIYHAEFLALAEAHPNFHYRQAISREHHGDRWGRYAHHVIDDEFDAFEGVLRDPSTLLYVCGMAGMEVGVAQCLAANGVADGFLRVPEELADVPPWDWDVDVARKRVRPTKRSFIEVY